MNEESPIKPKDDSSPQTRRGRPRKNLPASRPKRYFGFNRSVKERSKPQDAWDVIEKTLTYSLRERTRERRWRVFFRLINLLAFLFILFLIARCQQIESGAYRSLYPIAGEHLALIQVKGMIGNLGGPSLSVNSGSIKDSLQRAFRNKDAKAIFLSISSPGGSPVHSGRIYDEMMRLRDEYPNKKVYAVVDELAASAAYHIASAADEIYADDSSLIGSIGVISGGFGFEGTIEKLGLERRIYTSGENKAFLDPFSPENPEHVEFWQEVIDDLYYNFVEDVRRGRGSRISSDPNIFSGFLYDGERAIELGLIDGLGDLQSVAKSKTGIDDFVDYSRRGATLNRLLEGAVNQITGGFLKYVFEPKFQ